MTVVADPDVLRARARALRSLAGRLDASVLHELVAAAGDETWRGPTADAFVADARRAGRAVTDAAEDLWAAARTLEATAAASAIALATDAAASAAAARSTAGAPAAG